MQVGNGKQGVKIGEYSPENSREGQEMKARKRQDSNDCLGWIEPAGDKPQWIMWFYRDGSALLYTQRLYDDKNNGAVMGDPIRVSAKKGAHTKILSRSKQERTLQQIFVN